MAQPKVPAYSIRAFKKLAREKTISIKRESRENVHFSYWDMTAGNGEYLYYGVKHLDRDINKSLEQYSSDAENSFNGSVYNLRDDDILTIYRDPHVSPYINRTDVHCKTIYMGYIAQSSDNNVVKYLINNEREQLVLKITRSRAIGNNYVIINNHDEVEGTIIEINESGTGITEYLLSFPLKFDLRYKILLIAAVMIMSDDRALGRF